MNHDEIIERQWNRVERPLIPLSEDDPFSTNVREENPDRAYDEMRQEEFDNEREI